MIAELQNSNSPISILDASHLLNVSRSGFYRWKAKSTVTAGIDPNMILLVGIQAIITEFPGYGYRRVKYELDRRGHHANHKRVLRVMRENDLIIPKKRFKPQTTNSNHGYRIYPNLLRKREITGPNQVWASDITYIQLVEEFVYLAVVLDLWSRRCIGWALKRSLMTDLVIEALQMALNNRQDVDLDGLIHMCYRLTGSSQYL